MNNNSVLGKRNMSDRVQSSDQLINKIVMAQKKENSEREDQPEEQEMDSQYLDEDYDTPMMIRLRNQVRKNQSRMQFR